MKKNMKKNYVWLIGENCATTANNNSYYFWKKCVNIKDNIDKYLVLEKNKENIKVYNSLSSYEKKFVLWQNSINHYRKYFESDMMFVTLSYKDVFPSKLLFYKTKFKIKKPVIYLQHGTLGIKKIGYTGDCYNNNMFRFCVYNKQIKEQLITINKFKDYQLYDAEYPSRYSELLKRNDKLKDKKQIFWFITWRENFGNNTQTKLFIKKIKRVIKSNELREYLEKNDLKFKICVHSFFNKELLKDVYNEIKTDRISVITQQSTDLLDEIAKSKLCITDYSSIGFDFTFLNKPVILFQPDREEYLKKREMYASQEELEKNSIRSVSKLIENIVNEKYEVNQFYKSRLPSNIDYEYVKREKHIDRMYEEFSRIQNNKITFLGYNFWGEGGTACATRGLAEGLLEQGYLVELLSCKKTLKSIKRMPYGVNANYITTAKDKTKKEKIIEIIYTILGFLQKNKYNKYFKHDSAYKWINPYCGYKLTKLMKNIKTNTLVSVRESLHLFLNDCISENVTNKIYFFHASSNIIEDVFPGIMDEIKDKRIPKAIFVTNKNRLSLKEKFDYENYDKYKIIGNTLEGYKTLTLEDINEIEKKDVYRGIYLLRISKERKDDIKNLFDFGLYLKEHNVENFILDVYGTGDYLNEFLNILDQKELDDVINYKGYTGNPIGEIRKHDLVVDLSVNNSFGMTYLEGVLNGKKVFCMKNEGSLETMADIPNSYIESFEDLHEKINNLDKTTKEELLDNYNKISKKYSREVVAKQFLDFLETK